jgi:hypothetical protein
VPSIISFGDIRYQETTLTMRSVFSVAAAVLGLTSTLSVATPVPPQPSPDPFPLSDGFPNPSAQQLLEIEVDAFGTLSNATPPATVSSQGLANLRFVAINELFEVAFFNDLIFNITNNVPGYEIDGNPVYDDVRDLLVTMLNAALAVGLP